MVIPWVVKLGGSLARSVELPRWLDALMACPVVIVPGGGAFADAIRDSQRHWQFDDATAHQMAILGMAQYGLMLHGLKGGLQLQADWQQLKAGTPESHAEVWWPDPFSLDREGLDASWEVTSDSLSLWLAGRLNLNRLLLVKSVEPPRGEAPVAALVAAGLLDAAFSRMSGAATCEVWLCGPRSHQSLQHSLRQPAAHFTRVLTH